MMRFAYPAIEFDAKTISHFAKIFESGWVSNSDYVRELEKHFSETYNVKHAIGCCNATQGLSTAITAAGWKDRKVLVPAFTWPSTIYAIERNACTPVFADINPATWAIDPDSVSDDYDAAIPVDIFGNQICHQFPDNIPVIYDAAHGYGLPKLGQRGLAEVVSMSHTKYPTCSEGGMILTNDPDVAERAIELRRLAARLSEFNAIIGLNSIRNYEFLKTKRKELIERYISGIKQPYKLQEIPEFTNHSVFAMLFEPELRDSIAKKLSEENLIETKIYYEPIVRGLPNTEAVFSQILALPTHLKMFEVVDAVIACVNKI